MRCLKLFLCLAVFLCFQRTALAALPPDAPKDVKFILGFYYGNGENILIRENNGGLELLYRFAQEDKCFARANIFPLKKERFDSYTLTEAGPLSGSEASVRFDRDADGYGITCRIGGHRYSRLFFGQGTGEKPALFRLPPRENWEEMRREAAQAVVPAALAAGRQAQLVNLAGIPGVKIDSRYAVRDNFFGEPLYTSGNLYLSSDAAAALAKVQQELASWGYGLVVWDAYRPWAVSKLAHLALPADSKNMLEDPEVKGSPHNTGNAVDVGLYLLETGADVELASGFDEPSLRQYASYPGGTSRQRYLGALLRNIMQKYGFQGIEMEWGHFEFARGETYAHLNIPLEQLQ